MFKKFYTLCMASLVAVSLFAADIAGRITLSIAANNNYALLIDGKRYLATNNRMYLNDLRSGQHRIQVYALQRTNRRSLRPMHSTTFVVRPQYNMHIAIDRNGYVHFEETPIRGRNNIDRYNRADGNRHWDDRNSRNWNEHNNENRDDWDWNRKDDRWEGNRALSEYDYHQLVQQVRSQWTASSKHNTAKDAVSRNYFSTQQVSGLLQLFSSENERLDLAKRAYAHTVDQPNYGQLYNLFSRSAQQDLDYYIRSHRY